MKPLSGRLLNVSRVAFHIRAVICDERSETKHLIKNLPVLVDEKTHAWLLAHPQAEVTIDVEQSTLSLPDGTTVKFPLEGFARYCLLNGVDELGYLLSKDEAISSYEERAAYQQTHR